MTKRLLPIILTVLLVIPVSVSAGKHDHDGAWLGIYTQSVDEDLKEAFGLDSDHGAIVKSIIPDSPAEEAGLKEGDVILKIDADRVKDADDLVFIVGDREPGDEVELYIIREGEVQTLVAELDDRDDYDHAKEHYKKAIKWIDKKAPKTFTWQCKHDESEFSGTYIGVSLQSLNAQLGEYFGVTDGEGVLVSEVMADSPAEKAGLKAGDVIIEIAGEEAEDPGDIQEAVSETEAGDKIELSVLRNKKEMEFSLVVAEAPEDFYSMPGFHSPDFDDDFLWVPRTKGIFHGNFDHDFFDAEDMEDWREEMEESMKELREELKEIRERLE